MTQKYLVELQDKTKYEFLNQYGEILHIAKLSGLIVVEGDSSIENKLSKHPNVKDIRKSDKLAFVPQDTAAALPLNPQWIDSCPATSFHPHS